MPQIDGQPDHAAPVTVVRTEGFSPKAIAATVWALVTPFLLTGAAALVAHIAGNPGLLASLPWWVQVPAMAIVSTLAVSLAAYRASPGVVTLAKGSRRV